jgi:hypothetical protein
MDTSVLDDLFEERIMKMEPNTSDPQTSLILGILFFLPFWLLMAALVYKITLSMNMLVFVIVVGVLLIGGMILNYMRYK